MEQAAKHAATSLEQICARMTLFDRRCGKQAPFQGCDNGVLGKVVTMVVWGCSACVHCETCAVLSIRSCGASRLKPQDS
eukprot:6205985-Pleurochrysis_carterae.AAC.2